MNLIIVCRAKYQLNLYPLSLGIIFKCIFYQLFLLIKKLNFLWRAMITK